MIQEKLAQVLAEEKSALQLLIEIRQIEAELNEAKKQIEALAIKEAREYDKQVLYGFRVEVRQSGAAWDFSGVEQVQNLKNKLKEAEESGKSAYRAYQQGKTLVDENGEIVPLPSYKAGKETVFLTRKP
jgi:hypothetical protein